MFPTKQGLTRMNDDESSMADFSGLQSAPINRVVYHGPPARRQVVLRHINVTGKHVLEIGAWDRPVFRNPEVNLKVCDLVPTEELVSRAAGVDGLHPESVPLVNYVTKSPILSDYIDDKFDLVVGCHVIEHVPNLLSWLLEIRKLLNPAGKVFFAIPDRRYTYDYLRRETSVIDVLRAYSDCHIKPNFWRLLEATYMHRPINGAEAWHAEILAKRLADGVYLISAIRLARAKSLWQYSDTHCNVFTPESFQNLFGELKAAGLLPFTVDEVTVTERAQMEFYVMLTNDDAFRGLPPEVDELRLTLR
jgi:SAM-dependent methyltransferase